MHHTRKRYEILCIPTILIDHSTKRDGLCSVPPQMQHVWAVDVDFGMSDCLVLQQLMSHVTGLTYDANSGLLTDPETQEQRFAVISGRAQHSNLAIIHYHVFFQMCKAHLIGYDDKVGIPPL